MFRMFRNFALFFMPFCKCLAQKLGNVISSVDASAATTANDAIQERKRKWSNWTEPLWWLTIFLWNVNNNQKWRFTDSAAKRQNRTKFWFFFCNFGWINSFQRKQCRFQKDNVLVNSVRFMMIYAEFANFKFNVFVCRLIRAHSVVIVANEPSIYITHTCV